MITPAQQLIVDQFTQTYPVRVGALANALDLEVVLSPLSPTISGLIEPKPDSDGKFRIRINKFETDERQRFTVAHEIAHYLLHRDRILSGIVDTVMYRSSLSSKLEAEANRLAADIVMPMSHVNAELATMGGVKDETAAIALARKFKVSIPAMKVRLGIR